jgi:hypothetical protein
VNHKLSVLENKVSNLTIFNQELMKENENLRKNYTSNENENDGNNGVDLKYRDLEYRLNVVTANLARAQQVGNDQLLARYDTYIYIYINVYIYKSIYIYIYIYISYVSISTFKLIEVNICIYIYINIYIYTFP